jgi:hypothetical protein
MDDMLRERKSPDPIVGTQLTELQSYHREYTRAFAHEPATLRVLVNLIARPLATPEAERNEVCPSHFCSRLPVLFRPPHLTRYLRSLGYPRSPPVLYLGPFRPPQPHLLPGICRRTA